MVPLMCWQSRRVYIAPNGRRYPECGNGWRNALVCLWLLSSMAIAVLFVYRMNQVGDDGGGGGGDTCSCCSYSSCPGSYDECYYYDGSYHQCCDSYTACRPLLGESILGLWNGTLGASKP
jgi:hypothetical protein